MPGIIDRVDRLRVGAPTAQTSGVDESDLTVVGDASVGGNLTVTGTLGLTGNVTLNGNLAVAGTTDLTGRLVVAAPASFSDAIDVSGAAVFSNTALFSGAVTLERAGYFAGGVRVSQGVLVNGAPTPTAGYVGIGNEVDARANATGRGTIAFPGAVNISNEVMLKVYSGTTAYWVPAFSGLYSQP